MTITEFDPSHELIVVASKVWGCGRSIELQLAVDTGSAATVLQPYVVDNLGYSARDGIATRWVASAIGREQGYTLKIAQIAALGFSFCDFEVHVFDLAAGHGIDGLIGLSLLASLDYTIRSKVGQLLCRPAIDDKSR
ncbi:MAG TPA: retropepsin-like aspartic protease [Kofleriaceae bacterium]|nr:retropepsin-like aspartic protease [Kofleriaceae bacterium]